MRSRPDPWLSVLFELERTAKSGGEIVLIKAVAELYRRWLFQTRMNCLLMVAVAFFSVAELIRWGLLVRSLL